jgi:hypothetical protein
MTGGRDFGRLEIERLLHVRTKTTGPMATTTAMTRADAVYPSRALSRC